jgi:3-hydroxyacyl-CoA dehydrogenase
VADAKLGLPEVKIGLLPGAGGTQRLPRLIGLESALNMIVRGDPVPAVKFSGTALVDRIIEGELVAGAVAFAEEVLDQNLPVRRARDLQVKDPQGDAFLQFARNTISATVKHFPAPLKCLESVAASLTHGFDEGLKLEREGFLALMATPESRALRHVFAAERAAAKIPDLAPGTPLRAIAKVGVIGAGTMGGGIAMNFANASVSIAAHAPLLQKRQRALRVGAAGRPRKI